ncbi:hypothetical protein FQA39_LY16853 [Lamprigera yunnana]|nr:hypothetical protein FQA39_LY16853 [Lamprigera yunnana]
MGKTEDITDDVKILYHWDYSEELSSTMMPTIPMIASDSIRNGNNFIKTITPQCDYRTCTFNRYDAEVIFQLKPIINYCLELMRSSGLKGFYNNIVECVIIQKSKREEIRRMAGINIGDFQVYDDGGAYEIFEQTLNLKYNDSLNHSLKLNTIFSSNFCRELSDRFSKGIEICNKYLKGNICLKCLQIQLFSNNLEEYF